MDITTIDSQTYSTNSGMEIATESATSLLSQSTILPSDSNTDNTMTSTLSTVIGTTFTNNENNDYESMTSKIIETITTTATTNIIKESSDENLIQTTTTKIPILATSLIDNTLTSTIETPDFTTIATTTIKNKLSVSDLSSSLQLFGWADYLVFVLMLVVCAMIGIYFGFVEKNKQAKRNKSNGGVQARRGSEALDYLVGGRKMQTFPVSMSLVASFISGISLLGTSTEIYVYGTQYAFLLITIIISSFISWHIFLPVFCNLQLTSTYEYFEMRFDKRIRLLGSMLFVIGTMLWLPIVIYVPALAFNQVTGINIHIITPVVCVVCIFYTCVGGLKAVVWTDVLQSFIMYGSMILVIIKGTMNVGGLSEVINLNYGSGRLEGPHFTMDHTTRYSVWSVFIGSTVHWLQNTCANQVMMQRFLALPNLKKARHALIIFVIGLIVLYSFCIYNGLLIYATYHQCDPLKTKLAKAHDQLVPLLVMDILGIFPGMPGLFVAGVFSAALSSLSTGLNSLTAVFLEDFVKPYRKTPLTERQTEIFMKTAVVLCGIVCVALVFVVERLGMVLQLSATMGALTNGPLLGVFFVGVLLPWVNGRSALFGGVISFILMGYVAIRAQIDMATGKLVFPTKPTSVEGCNYLHNYTSPIHSDDAFIDNLEKPFYHMSFMFYTVFGCITTIVCSCLSTLVFGFANTEDMDPILFSPVIRKYIKTKEYFSIRSGIKEMQTIITADDKMENHENHNGNNDHNENIKLNQ
ncbi:sodium-coupled monocarboxylate transporter 1 isoform X1 [Condylostylus longicornis]|uniref:sodium-coupled monocarboxylate transporter 1 isoform X1 n=1 Tax=Condylostylus longicornis TaxID=2530218 RepID=UPI00244DEDA2|nr:sodium-coupled monocarboxylate transporter 1 isoform X1 [Condylostylus longicornis]